MDDPRAECVIALDVGGTQVKSGIVARGGQLAGAPEARAIASEGAAEDILETLGAVIEEQRAGIEAGRVRGIALGFPGPADYEKGICYIEGLAKFGALYGVNIKEALEARFDLPVLMRNDAEAAIVGEARYGAGRAYRRLIGLTLGTGLGSAFLAAGEPQRGGRGVPPNGWLYPVRFRGERADDVFSIRGLKRRAARAGIAMEEAKELAERAGAGDAPERAVFAEFGAALGEFLRPFVLDFGAEAVIVLGGLAGAFELLEAGLGRVTGVRALPGELGTAAGLCGAAELFFH